MRGIWFVVLICTTLTSAPHAQEAMTDRQRTADLNQLASFYAKNYAPYEWKRDVFGFDLFQLQPWLRESHKADDLDFQEVLIDYVASLNDVCRRAAISRSRSGGDIGAHAACVVHSLHSGRSRQH